MTYKTKFIAEIGNHNRSLKRCYQLIDKAKLWVFLQLNFNYLKLRNYSQKTQKLFRNTKNKKERTPRSFIPNFLDIVKKKNQI